ncbi:MAG: A/G-specific adenine glycosylase [Bdellovibrionia bacterium]
MIKSLARLKTLKNQSPLPRALQQLVHWFQCKQRDLPWRDQPSYYRVWVSEIMLQQTQVVSVIPYFERFMARFPDLESLARAPLEEVLLLWAGLGYYSRARNLHQGAKKLLEFWGETGQFPKTRAQWLEIPGVGQYTAGAVLSIAGNYPEPLLDGNVERVLSRVRRVGSAAGQAIYKKRLWRLSTLVVQGGYSLGLLPSQLNQALMELGATICTPKKPQCGHCPISSVCRAHQMRVEQEYPPKKKPKSWVRVEETRYCILNSQAEVLLTQSPQGKWRAGLWDLLEFCPRVKKGKLLTLGEMESEHVVTRHKIRRLTHVLRLQGSAEKEILTHLMSQDSGETHPVQWAWVSLRTPGVPMGAALKKNLKAVIQRYPGVLQES